MEFGLWQLDEKVPSCGMCCKRFWIALVHRRQVREYEEDPEKPCLWCKIPSLEEDNVTAWEVFSLCSAQMHVVGMGSPLGIRWDAIDRAMDLYGVHPLDRDSVFFRIDALGKAYADLLRRRHEESLPADQRPRKAAAEPPPMWESMEEKLETLERRLPLFPDQMVMDEVDDDGETLQEGQG